MKNRIIADGGRRDEDLDEYVCEVFRQLDYDRRGAVSREDFETLCEVLGLPTEPHPSPPQSNRTSGLEWLSSYRPRADSPVISPLRMDRLAEVKLKKQQQQQQQQQQPSVGPKFLFTLGERPFWELWPHRKWRQRRRRLTVDEFKRCLLEQWARAEGMPRAAVGTVLPVRIAATTANGGGGGKRASRRFDVIDRSDTNWF